MQQMELDFKFKTHSAINEPIVIQADCDGMCEWNEMK